EIYKNKTSPNPSPPLPSLVLPVYDPPPPPLAMGLLDALYRVVMRRNAVYVTFVVAGAFAGERAVDYGVHKIWDMNNLGKRYEDIPVLGQRPAEE
ncbi:hypothetical protein BDA96_05G025300, partial [Sorghum bicolor]